MMVVNYGMAQLADRRGNLNCWATGCRAGHTSFLNSDRSVRPVTLRESC